jgi:two-component sensor histidine kinase
VAREHHLLEGQQRLQRLLGQESDRRLLNGLQLVASLLSLQARRTDSPRVGSELGIAARRVTMIGNLHRRLHGMDEAEFVDLTGQLQSVCQELVEMLAIDGHEGAITFSAPTHPSCNSELGHSAGLNCRRIPH